MVVAIDALIIGGGVAGLMAALRLAKCKKTVAVLVKTDVTECSTWYAQGGMSAVPSEGGVPLHGDSFDSHVRDTMDAGDGLSDPGVAEHFSRNAMHIIDELIGFGVEFTKSDSGGYTYSLHQEGGHSAPRVFHCADHTGRSVLEVLTAVAQATEHIRIYEHHMAIDLITERRLQSVHAAFGPNGESVVRRSKRRRPAGRPIPRDTCVGVYALDTRTGGVTAFAARVTFLATGGTGRVYLYTSNPDTNTGDGLAMYYRLGYPLRDMEFIQFHPTCFYNPNSKCPDQRRFLITEALRGKNVGGRLTLSRDPPEDFVLRYHRDGSAATRDVVAQAIDTEMKQRGLAHVWLNVTPAVTGVTAQALRDGYPDIFRHCYECGVDLTAEPIPVVPAAHYTCGGIPVDLSGCTQVERLYAVGECASTGLHGANRLASNSLTEAALYGVQAADHAIMRMGDDDGFYEGVPEWQVGEAKQSRDLVQVAFHWDEVRHVMWNLVGIARTEQRLLMAKVRIQNILEEVTRYYWNFYVTKDLLELRNIATVAEIIIQAALLRRETRGGHCRVDVSPD